MHIRASQARDPRTRRTTRHRIPRKIDPRHVTHLQQTRPRQTPIPAAPRRLGDAAGTTRAHQREISKQDVADAAPAAAAGHAAGLVHAVAAAGLQRRDAYPGFDVRAVLHVVVVARDEHVAHHDVLHGGVFQVLAQRADGHAVAAAAGRVLDVDVVAARLDGDAVVAALVDEVRQRDVAGVHRVEAVGVLDPVFAVAGWVG